MNNQISKKLLKFREEIDNIDEQIIQLLNQRIKIVAKVGKYKKNNNERFFIKSAREADMIKNLIAKADKSMPKSAIINIWRKIITSSNTLEQNLKIALHNPGKIADYLYLIREYYGDFVPVDSYNNVADVILEIEKHEAQIAVFVLPDEDNQSDKNNYDDNSENWWIYLANSKQIKIYAKIPFIHYQDEQPVRKANLVVAAIKAPEHSSEDKTLLSVEINNKIPRRNLGNNLAQAGFKYKILKEANLPQIENITFYLIEINGFFENDDPAIEAFSQSEIKPYVKIVGHYPTPIEL